MTNNPSQGSIASPSCPEFAYPLHALEDTNALHGGTDNDTNLFANGDSPTKAATTRSFLKTHRSMT